MRTALEMATFFWVGPISLLAAGRGKTGARADFGESSRDRTWRKRRIKTPGGQPGWSAEGVTTGHKGMDAMGWGWENTKVQRGSTEPPPKRGTGNLGEGVQLAEDLDLDLDSKKPPRKSNGGKQPCRVVARLRLSASTRRHVTLLPPGPEKGPDVSPFAPWEKRGWPVWWWTPDAPTARPNRRRDAVPNRALVSSPAAAWQPAHSVLPPACTRSRGLCFESRSWKKPFRPLLRYGTAVNRLPKHLQT